MIIPMLCVTIFVILVVWFLLPRVARLMIHTPTARSEERFSRNAETDLVCRLLLEKKKPSPSPKLGVSEDARTVTWVFGENRVVFHKLAGRIAAWILAGVPVLIEGPRLNLWRARIDNDWMFGLPQGFTNTWEAAGYHALLFFFNDSAATAIYTLSLHDALPI